MNIEILPGPAALVDQPCNLSVAERKQAAEELLALIDKINKNR